jgi:hypothetical protein
LYAEKVRSQSKGEVRIRSERKATKQRRGALYVERKRERERERAGLLELKADGCGSSTVRCERDVG